MSTCCSCSFFSQFNILFINVLRAHLQKQITQFLTIFNNRVFSLCIPINLNQTAVGLF